MNDINRLVCVSNRLPIVLSQDGAEWGVKPGSGGLITALEPVLRNRGGVWIGWPGVAAADGLDEALREASRDAGYNLRPVHLTQEEVDAFYFGFSNETVWPLFHGLTGRAKYTPEHWQAYETVNRKFAEVIARVGRSEDFIWIQDYHLMLVARDLKALGRELKTAFFLHIPFPAPEIFLQLPWRSQILEGLLAYDLVGFQTLQDRNNFVQCLKLVGLPELRVQGRGPVQTVTWHGRELRVGAFPISIDFEGIQRLATSPEVTASAADFHEQFGKRRLIIGMDRLDYTKGIPERLQALRLALQRHPELRGAVTLVQVTVPSREKVPEYEALLAEIERLVGNINGEFTVPGEWVPIHYIHRSLSRADTMAYLRAAEIALVTPLRDGMNLVAKEFCACDADESGVLILSEFAGAASELKRGALMVNPHDVEGTAEAIWQAYRMSRPERRKRMRRLRDTVRSADIYHWVGSILEAAYVPQLESFPVNEQFVPDMRMETWA